MTQKELQEAQATAAHYAGNGWACPPWAVRRLLQAVNLTPLQHQAVIVALEDLAARSPIGLTDSEREAINAEAKWPSAG